MKIAVVQFGFDEVRQNLGKMGEAAISIRPALDIIVEQILFIEDTIFESQGRRGGGSWKRVTPDWQYRKRRVRGADPRILHFGYRWEKGVGYIKKDSTLRRSVTVRGDKNMVLRVDNRTGIIFGSRLPYARKIQLGLGEQPQRKFIKFTKGDRERFAGEVRAHIFLVWERSSKKRAR